MLGCSLSVVLSFFSFSAIALASQCYTTGLPLVRNISEIPQDNYGRVGLSHVTVAGSMLHGMKEVPNKIYLTMLRYGFRHFHRDHTRRFTGILVKQFSLSSKGVEPFILHQVHIKSTPGKPEEHFIFPNSTFHIPVNDAYQVWNTNEHEDLQVLAIISRPPVKVFIYEDWFMPHTAAKLKFPYYWDEQCNQSPQKDEL